MTETLASHGEDCVPGGAGRQADAGSGEPEERGQLRERCVERGDGGQAGGGGGDQAVRVCGALRELDFLDSETSGQKWESIIVRLGDLRCSRTQLDDLVAPKVVFQPLGGWNSFIERASSRMPIV